LLADPDWVRKVEEDREDDIVRCIWCNVCKQLDENFHQVTCFLWPKNADQAPREDPKGARPRWPESGAGLEARVEKGAIKLTWRRCENVVGYDIHRAEDDGAVVCVEAVKAARYTDRAVLGGLRYTYHVKAFDKSGSAGPPSNTVRVDMPTPEFVGGHATEEVSGNV
jgi:hypothetical protein